MERIESRVEPGKLLHIIHRDADLHKYGLACSSRIDLVPESEGLQVAALKMKNKDKFKAHYHIPRPREIPITQECWVVVFGIVRVSYYDTDQSLIGHRVLTAGDVTITIAGGHNYECCTANTRVVEIKNGPFVGVDADKVLIDA